MPFYPAYPMVGQVFVLMAFVAVVLGTLGNVIGALVASLMMGSRNRLGSSSSVPIQDRSWSSRCCC